MADLFYHTVVGSFRLFFKFFYRYSVFGLEHLEKGGGILAANHLSYLDPPLVAASYPERMYSLAKKSLFEIPFVGWLIRAIGAYPVEGNAKDLSIFKVMRRLVKDEGKKVLIFPEGTRGFTETLNPLKRGVGLMIAKSESRVYPVYIHGTLSIWHRKRKIPRFRGRIACIFGSPIDWEEYAHLPTKEGQKEVLHALEGQLDALKRWYEDGHVGSPP